MKSLIAFIQEAANALRFWTGMRLIVGLTTLSLLFEPSRLTATDKPTVAAVFSAVKNDYARTKLPDGTYKKEYYALARGHYEPGMAKDHSIDDVKFPQVAGVVATYLAKQGYYMAEDSKSADLLLVITWGTTIPMNSGIVELAKDQLMDAMRAGPMPTGPHGWVTGMAMSGTGGAPGPVQPPTGGAAGPDFETALINMQSVNAARFRADDAIARLLGYNHEIEERDTIARFAGNGDVYDSLISDIEEERYYVIVSAYDFKAAKNEKKEKPLWSTRVSIRVRQNQFNDRLPEMIAKASRYFGTSSRGLLRESTEGTATIKDLTILGSVPESDISNPSRKNNGENPK